MQGLDEELNAVGILFRVLGCEKVRIDHENSDVEFVGQSGVIVESEVLPEQMSVFICVPKKMLEGVEAVLEDSLESLARRVCARWCPKCQTETDTGRCGIKVPSGLSSTYGCEPWRRATDLGVHKEDCGSNRSIRVLHFIGYQRDPIIDESAFCISSAQVVS